MTNKILILIAAVFMLVSCNNNWSQDMAKVEAPKALEDNGGSFEFVSRSTGDMVQDLYGEVANKDATLKGLEEKINGINKRRNDTANQFADFDGKNKSYFNSADRHVAEISDSVLRNKMRILIADNLALYNISVAKHNELLKIIEASSVTISDLHNVLEIITTLPLIGKYQKDNLPRTKPLEDYIKQQDNTIRLEDSLTRK